MADIKQGVNYEITADDKTKSAVDSATTNLDKAGKKAKDVGEKCEEATKKGGEGFNALSLATNALSGNFAGCAQELAKLIPKFKAAGTAGSMAFAAVGGAILGATKFVLSLKDLLHTAFKASSLTKDLRQVSSTLADIKAHAEDFSAKMTTAREESERQKKIFENELDALHKLTNAQNEFNRAQELALATSEEMRSEINLRYDAAAAENQEYVAAEQRKRNRTNLKEEESRLREELSAAEKRRDELLEISQNMTQKANDDKTGFWGSLWGGVKNFFTGKVYGNDKALAAANAGTQASNEYFAELEKITELQKKIDDNLHSQKIADSEEKAAKEEQKARRQQTINKAWEIHDKETQTIEDAEIKRVEKVKAAELKANREVMSERQKALAELTAQESEAAARVAAAQSKVAEAWSWYRDKDKMAAQLKEEKAEAEAQKQFEKDFEKLRSRRDWRKAKDLSVDQEAVRRVALAKEEETAAQKALAETAKSTAQAAASLAEIEKVITQEG